MRLIGDCSASSHDLFTSRGESAGEKEGRKAGGQAGGRTRRHAHGGQMVLGAGKAASMELEMAGERMGVRLASRAARTREGSTRYTSQPRRCAAHAVFG